MKSRADIISRLSATPTAPQSFYESMREVAPGDLIFSFMDTRMHWLYIVQSYAWESLNRWSSEVLARTGKALAGGEGPIHRACQKDPAEGSHRDLETTSPKILATPANGNGLQSVYLTATPAPLAEVLIGLIGQEVAPLALSATRCSDFDG